MTDFKMCTFMEEHKPKRTEKGITVPWEVSKRPSVAVDWRITLKKQDVRSESE